MRIGHGHLTRHRGGAPSVRACAGSALLALGLLLLAACGAHAPDADDWALGPDATGRVVEAPLPAGYGQSPPGLAGIARAMYSIPERALYLPVFGAPGQSVYRYDIPARRGRWQPAPPESAALRRLAFEGAALFGSSRVLRDRDGPLAPAVQPFGTARLRLAQQESTYSRTWYNVGFPFGQSGWMTQRFGDGRLDLSVVDPSGDERLLLSQTYRADNVPFTAAWSPDGRHVLVIESLESASYYRIRAGREPALRFAVFGPFDVDKTRAEIVHALSEADERRRQRRLDRDLEQGRIAASERYGAFYQELIATIRSCPALLAVTGSIDALTLQPSRTLKLSDGHGDADGLYFTFELHAANGSGSLQAAAFRPETPPAVRREILARMIRYDLTFEGRQYFIDDCEP
jgi:hypothetical protein